MSVVPWNTIVYITGQIESQSRVPQLNYLWENLSHRSILLIWFAVLPTSRRRNGRWWLCKIISTAAKIILHYDLHRTLDLSCDVRIHLKNEDHLLSQSVLVSLRIEVKSGNSNITNRWRHTRALDRLCIDVRPYTIGLRRFYRPSTEWI